MWLILLCSVVSIAVFAERLLYFHRVTINLGEFLQGLSNLVRKRNLAEARVECQATSVPVTRVIHAALIRHNLPRNGASGNRPGSRATGGPPPGAQSRDAHCDRVHLPAHRITRNRHRPDPGVCPIIRKQRVRHPRRRLRWDLPELADHRRWSGGDDSYHPRLLPSCLRV